MPDQPLIADDRLRQFRDDDTVCASPFERAMAAELLDARTRIADLQGECAADEFGIQSLTTENGVATLAIVPTTEQARELVLTMSLACGQMLDADQAQNYIEFEASPANRPGYVVHVRRAGGPSPHTLRREAEARITELETERDKGYRDRAEVVALLATIFPSKMADPSDETGWPVLYLDTPEGQLSWHINPADLDLFNTEVYALALDEDPESAPVWDGHTNEQKSTRLHRLATCYQPANFLVEPHEIDQLRGSIAAWQMNDRVQRARITELEQVERYAMERALAAESKLEEERADFKAAEAELEQQAGQSLGYVVVLKDNEGDLTCLASVFGPDAVRTAEGIGSGYAASKGDEYLIAELREVSDR